MFALDRGGLSSRKVHLMSVYFWLSTGAKTSSSDGCVGVSVRLAVHDHTCSEPGTAAVKCTVLCGGTCQQVMGTCHHLKKAQIEKAVPGI